MKRRLFVISIALAASMGLSACGGSSTSSLPGVTTFGKHGSGSSPIQHIVMIVQENRSFDNLFATFPGANGAKRGKGKIKKGSGYADKWFKFKQHTLWYTTDIGHCHSAFETDYDNGKMDGFNTVSRGVCGSHAKPIGALAYTYVKQVDIAPYWDIANQWVLADAMFQTQGSGSFTAHQDLIRGGTMIQTSPVMSLVDNPTLMPWGCDAPSKTTTYTIDGYGNVASNGPFPCSNKFPDYGSGGYKTLGDLMDAKGVQWKYYSPCFSASPGPSCNNDCKTCGGALLNAFDVIDPVRYGPEWGTNVSMPETNIFTDIGDGTLPAVSWVIPEDDANDHPGSKKNVKGPSWVASVVDAVGQSQYWNSSVIIVLWDDWGGFYDNAKPPFQDQWGGLGFRVPMLVLSPYAKAGSGSQGGYISHTQYEFASILRYIEDNWSLGHLGTTDTRQGLNSIQDIFDYSQNPRQFTTIPSEFDAKYFQTRARTPQHGDPE